MAATAMMPLAAMLAPAPAFAQAQTYNLNIPAMDLGDALRAFGRATRQQVVFSGAAVRGRRSNAIDGSYAARDALDRMIAGSGLQVRVGSGGIFMVTPAGNGEMTTGEGEAGGAAADSGSAEEQEIVVTAQKREERLQDVPAPVSVVRTQTLASNNETRLSDYFMRVPGFNVSPAAQSAQVLSIRGLTTAAGNPTVGVVVDDVPYGGTISGGGGLVVPDIDPSEFERIEVLRGPQGTLYGAASLGGLFKLVTVDPSFDRVGGRLQAGVGFVENGDTIGYQLRGAINVPLGDRLAVRASGFYRHDPGYVDDPGRGLNGINEAQARGGRISLLWQASDAIRVKLSALYQRIEGDGTAEVFPSLGDLQQRYSRGIGGYDRETQAYSATVTADLDFGQLTSITGYNVNAMTDWLDYTFLRGAAARALFGAATTDAPYVEDQQTEKFTQEIRLAMPVADRIDWLIGGFYTDESNSWVQRILAYNPTTGQYPGTLLAVDFPTSYEEFALFSNVAVEITDQFDVQLGARQAWNKQTYDEVLTGALLGGATRVLPTRRSDLDAFTYLLTARYRPSDHLMLYGRIASGYQAGGPNTSLGGGPSYEPSTTVNYEIGVKGDLLDRALRFDISAYHIDWQDIQLTLVGASGGYKVNGSGARSQGFEASLEARPWTGMTATGFVAYNNAELTRPFAATIAAYGQPGDRLPLSARWTANLSLEQSVALPHGVEAYFGGSLSYVGDRLGQFRGFTAAGAPLPRQLLPDYTKVDLRAGLRSNGWSANLYVNNLTDRRGVLNGGLGTFDDRAFQLLQPRTIGVTLAMSF